MTSHVLQPAQCRQKHLGTACKWTNTGQEVAQCVRTLRGNTVVHRQQMHRSSRPTSDHARKANVGEHNGKQPASQAQTRDAT